MAVGGDESAFSWVFSKNTISWPWCRLFVYLCACTLMFASQTGSLSCQLVAFYCCLNYPPNIYFLLISELQTLTGDWLGSLCRMNNVTHNLHLNGQTTVAWKTLLYVLVGICFFGCLSIALCSFHTIYLYVGFKCFWFYLNKSTGRVWHVCVNSQMLDFFLVSFSPRPPEVGHVPLMNSAMIPSPPL